MRRSISLLLDLLLIALSTVAALALRDNFQVSGESLARIVPHILTTLIIAAPTFVLIQQDRLIWRLSGLSDYVRIVFAIVVIILLSTTIGFTFRRLDGVSRSLPVLQGIVMIFALVGVRVLTREYHGWRRRGRKIQPPADAILQARDCVLVVGVNRIAELYLESVAEFASDRIVIAGLLGRSERHNGRMIQQQRILGMPQDVARVLKELELHGLFVTRIVIAMEFQRLPREAQDALLAVARGTNIELDFFAERTRIVPRGGDGSRGGGGLHREASDSEQQTFSFDEDRLRQLGERRYWATKRVIDMTVAALLLPFVAAMTAVFGLALATQIGVPISFWQMRPGQNGRPFKVYKLRTLGDGIDKDGSRRADADREFALGRFLRRTRLDELPQLYNILIGQMSFVGPRPLLPEDQANACSARLLVRPGLTGWAQVHGGRGIGALDKAALDIWYVENASLWLDIETVARTIPMLLFGERTNEGRIGQAWRDLKAAGIYDGPLPTTAAIIDPN